MISSFLLNISDPLTGPGNGHSHHDFYWDDLVIGLMSQNRVSVICNISIPTFLFCWIPAPTLCQRNSGILILLVGASRLHSTHQASQQSEQCPFSRKHTELHSLGKETSCSSLPGLALPGWIPACVLKTFTKIKSEILQFWGCTSLLRPGLVL